MADVFFSATPVGIQRNNWLIRAATHEGMKGAKEFNAFGLNAKSQMRDIVVFPLISAVLAAIRVFVC